MLLRNLLRSHKIYKLLLLIFLIIISGCLRSPKTGLSFNPIPLSKGQWVEYVNSDIPYDDYHVKFVILNVNANGIMLETNYFTRKKIINKKIILQQQKKF